MTIAGWTVVIVSGVFLIVLVLLLARGYGQAIRTLALSIWNSPAGRLILVIFVLVMTLQIVKSYTRYSANEKAGDWLTQYNGRVATEVVGAIQGDRSSIFSDQSASPSPTPSSSPSPQSSPSPSPSPPAETASAGENKNAETKASTGGAVGQVTPTPSPTPTEIESSRLKAQLQIVRDRAKHHGNVMAFFYVNYFVSIVMVMTAGLLVAISLFFIAQAGWTGTNSYVKATFIVAAAYAAFYGLFPPVFQQQKNITDNKELFLHYKSLENELDSYPITLLTLKGETKLPREFINHVDAEMDRLGNIALGFDITRVSYDQAFDVGAARATPSPSVPASTPIPTPTKKP